jgi:type II secretion system protein N
VAIPQEGRVRRPLRIAAITGAALVLICFFTYLRFPYRDVADSVTARIERSTGLRIDVAEVGPGLQLLGPGITAHGVRLTQQSGVALTVDRIRVRPAWSLAWFTGRAAFFTDLETPLGTARGTLVLGRRPRRWWGELEDLDLERLLESLRVTSADVGGRVEATLDLSFGEAGPEGPVDFVARDGFFGHADMQFPVPFEEVVGELLLGGDHLLEIRTLTIRSPLLTGDVTGTVGHGEPAPLRLIAQLEPDASVRAALTAQGIRMDPAGGVTLEIQGTPDAPIIR